MRFNLGELTGPSDIETATLNRLRGCAYMLAKREKGKIMGQVRTVIDDGVARGKGMNAIAKDIKALGYAKDAKVLARTEIISAAKEAQTHHLPDGWRTIHGA